MWEWTISRLLPLWRWFVRFCDWIATLVLGGPASTVESGRRRNASAALCFVAAAWIVWFVGTKVVSSGSEILTFAKEAPKDRLHDSTPIVVALMAAKGALITAAASIAWRLMTLFERFAMPIERLVQLEEARSKKSSGDGNSASLDAVGITAQIEQLKQDVRRLVELSGGRSVTGRDDE